MIAVNISSEPSPAQAGEGRVRVAVGFNLSFSAFKRAAKFEPDLLMLTAMGLGVRIRMGCN